MINCKYPFMSLSEELSNYLKSKGATEVGYADIADFTTKKGTWKMRQLGSMFWSLWT